MTIPCSSFYKSTTAISLIFGLGLSATNAADKTITTAVTLQQSIANNATLTIKETGSVTTSINAVVGAIGETITVINHGAIESRDNDGINAATLNLENTGTIIGDDGGVVATTITNLINSGTITGDAENGVQATTITNLTNSGTIKAGDNGVEATTLTNMTNSGTITGRHYGVQATTLTNLTNSGTITGRHNGVQATTLTNLTNSGTITGRDNGVQATTLTNLTNSGTITAGDDGVRANEIKYLKNLAGGVIKSTGTSAAKNGIDMDFGVIDNAGTISGFVGIEADGGSDSTITNSGTIASNQGAAGVAINLGGVDANIINLNAGSVIIGSIKWDGTDDTLNLGKGLDAEITLNTAAPALTVNFGTGVGVVNGTTIVQVDVSGASLAGSLGSHVGQAIGGAVNTRTGSTRGNRYGNTSNGVGYSFADGKVERTAWGLLWAAGSKQEASGTLSAASSASGGATSGIDWLDAEGNLLGFHAGVGTGRVSVDVTNGQTIDTQTYVGGVYGSKTNDNFVFDYNISAGMINFDGTRHVSTASGIQTAKASYKGVLLAPEFTISRETDAGFTPSIGFGYTGLFLEGYTETGPSASNIAMSSRSIHYATAKGQIEFNKDITNEDGKTTMFRPYLGLEGKAGFGDVNTGTITVAGSTLNFNTGSAKNTARGFAGANFSKDIAENTKFFGNVEVGYNSNKSFDGRVSLGLSKTF